MFWTILDILLGTSFRKAGMGKQYRVAKKGVKYVYKHVKAPKGRSSSNSSKPITENQILEFKKLQKRVKKLDSSKINDSEFDVYQKVRREEDKRTFHVIPVTEKFENIDPRYLDRGDYHLIREVIQKKIAKLKKEKALQIERDLNLKKYGKSETNRERTLRLNKNQRDLNFKKYGIRETNAERKIREEKVKKLNS